MAEATRRTKVKPFTHGATLRMSPQTNLEDALLMVQGDCTCNMVGSIGPPSGSVVHVRIATGRGVEVVWGNQVAAKIIGARGKEVADAISFSGKANGVKRATVVSSNVSQRELVIKFGN